MSDKYTTETASIRATIGKFRKLDTDKLTIKGQDISELVGTGGSVAEIKHAQDTRETVTDDDLWGQWVETLDDGTVIIHDTVFDNPDTSKAWKETISKIEDNKAYADGSFWANIQTDKLRDGTRLCYQTSLASFDSDLSSLENGNRMFYWCRDLEEFYGTLSSLRTAPEMFLSCDKLRVFDEDMPNLVNGNSMFYYCVNLASNDTFASDLSQLEDGTFMFYSCYGMEEFYSTLSSLVNGNSMFFYCSNLSNFSSDLSSLVCGDRMFMNCERLQKFRLFYNSLSSLSSGVEMFQCCENLTSFNGDLPSLTNGHLMFYETGLASFGVNLPSLLKGYAMFGYCDNLKSFNSNLPKMTNGYGMFQHAYSLTQFNGDLSSLVNGRYMFQFCSPTTFNSDLSSLINGQQMFEYCENLTSFTSDLSNLTTGNGMFSRCKLDAKSVMYIIHSIKDLSAEWQLYKSGSIPYVTELNGVCSAPRGFMSDTRYVYTYNNPQPYATTISGSEVGKLTIGIGVTNNSSTIDQQLQTFAEGTLFDSWDDLKQAFVKKGWTVTWQYGGKNDVITYDLRGGERLIPCPVYTRLIEILPEGIKHDEEGNEVGEKFYTKEQKARAEYCSEDGTKFYNIEWGHDVTHPEEFQQFDSLETACVSYGVMPKEYLETNGQPTLF